MKLVTFDRDGDRSYGSCSGERVHVPERDFRAAFPSLRSVLADANAIKWLSAVNESRVTYALGDVSLLPPIPDPAKIICIGINYETHRKETGRTESAYPSVFLRFADTQIGAGAPIVRPKVSTSLDFEGELAVVIGRGGRYILREHALEHVAGYSCYNDASLRDWQRHTHQFTPGKNFPNTGAFGPWLITADEIPDPSRLHLVTRLNGNVVQQAGTDSMIFSVEQIIEYVSSFTALSPGDVIATGTPGGVGFKREPPLFMKPGDQVEVEISSIGTLRNGIVDESNVTETPAAFTSAIRV